MRFEHYNPEYVGDQDVVSVATYDKERKLWVRHGVSSREYKANEDRAVAKLQRLNIDKLQRHDDADTAPAHTLNIP